jgi:hypothetical protein
MPIKDNETIKRDLSDYIVDEMYTAWEAPWDQDYEDGRKIAKFLLQWVMYQQTDAGRAQRAAAMDWEKFLRSAEVQHMHALKIMPELERLVYSWRYGRELNPKFATPIPEAMLTPEVQ